MVEKPTFQKAIIIGLSAGTIGAIIGFVPVYYLKTSLFEFILDVFNLTGKLRYTIVDIFELGIPIYPQHPVTWLVLPIGGSIFGCIGSFIGLQRNSSRLWLWGVLFGVLINFFVIIVIYLS